jgi:hypothetical protein
MSGGAGGKLVLSIDLELDIEHHDVQHQQRLDEVRRQLLELTRAAGVVATWAVADPLLSAATEPVLAAGCGHEIAVLGDQAWLGTGCGRARMAGELARRFTAARAAGIPVTTLALRNVEQVIDLDLLLDHGVTALALPAAEQPSFARKNAQPPIRFGLWQPPTAWKLPPRRAWLPALWRIRGEIKRAIRAGSLLHLRLDALRLVAACDQSLHVICEMLAYAARKRDAGQLAIATIGQLAAAELESRAAAPSRSVLRPAA